MIDPSSSAPALVRGRSSVQSTPAAPPNLLEIKDNHDSGTAAGLCERLPNAARLCHPAGGKLGETVRRLFLAAALLLATDPTFAQPRTDVAAIAARLRACQAGHGRECGQIVWGDGALSGIVVGTADRITWSRLVKIRAAAGGAGIEVHHSHPSDTPLSRDDLALLSWPGVGLVCAHGPTTSDCRARVWDALWSAP